MSFLTSRTRVARQGFGQPVRRGEDRRLLTGGGCYSDDFHLPGQVYACFLRSAQPRRRAALRRAASTAADGWSRAAGRRGGDDGDRGHTGRGARRSRGGERGLRTAAGGDEGARRRGARRAP